MVPHAFLIDGLNLKYFDAQLEEKFENLEGLLASQRERELEREREREKETSRDRERFSTSPAVKQLQALKQENQRLRANLEATQATVSRMGNEINQVRSEYQAVVEEFTGLGD